MSTNNLCFEQKYEIFKYESSENFQFLEVKFSTHFNMCVFVMVNRVMVASACPTIMWSQYRDYSLGMHLTHDEQEAHGPQSSPQLTTVS